MFETTYHFDKWKKDKEGEYFKILGKFDIDFTNEILLARTTEMKSKRFNEQPYNYANNKASVVNNVYHAIEDADNYAGQPNAEMFDAYRYNDDDRFIKFRKVAEWFELDKTKNQTITVKVITTDNKGLIVRPEGCAMDFQIKKSAIAINAADARPGRWTGGEKLDCAIAEIDLDKRKVVYGLD